MSGYYGYGYAHPYYYPSVGAWPWEYVGQVPASSPMPTFPPPPYRGPRYIGPGDEQTLTNVRNALIRWFIEVNQRPPSDLDLADFVVQAALGAYSAERFNAEQMQNRLAEVMRNTFTIYKGKFSHLAERPVLPQGV